LGNVVDQMGEGRSPITDGVKLAVINALNVQSHEKGDRSWRSIASLCSGVNQPWSGRKHEVRCSAMRKKYSRKSWGSWRENWMGRRCRRAQEKIAGETQLAPINFLFWVCGVGGVFILLGHYLWQVFW